MPIILYTYLITETLAPFFASLAILTGIMFLGRLIPIFDLIVDFGIGLPDFIRLCAFLVPNLFLFAIPMASMLGVILCFTRMGNDNELVALKAAGIGLYRMLPAVIIIAICTSAFTAYFSTTLIPTGTSAIKQLLVRLAKEKIDKGLQEKRFSEGINNVVLYVDRVDSDTDIWHGVYVSDTRDEVNPITIVARTGSLSVEMNKLQLTLQLEDGSMHMAKDTKTQTVTFKQYVIHIPLDQPASISENAAKSINRKEMTQQDIREYIAKHDSASDKSVAYLIEYHKRLALPGGCFILTILGLPLAIRTRPGQRSIGVPLGLVIFICYYVLLTLAQTISEQDVMPIALAMWMPNILFTALTMYILRFANRESTNSIIDFFLNMVSWFIRRLPKRRNIES